MISVKASTRLVESCGGRLDGLGQRPLRKAKFHLGGPMRPEHDLFRRDGIAVRDALKGETVEE